MNRRSIAIAQRSYILGALTAEVSYWKERAEDYRDLGDTVPAYVRGRLGTLRYGMFVAALLAILALLGLYRKTANNNSLALLSFILDNEQRLQDKDFRNEHTKTYGAYTAWREWERNLLAEGIKRSNAKTAAHREAANA